MAEKWQEPGQNPAHLLKVCFKILDTCNFILFFCLFFFLVCNFKYYEETTDYLPLDLLFSIGFLTYSLCFTHLLQQNLVLQRINCWISCPCPKRPCFIKMSLKLSTLKVKANGPPHTLSEFVLPGNESWPES